MSNRKKGVIHKTHDTFLCLFCYYEAANERILNLHYKLTHNVIRDKTKAKTIDIFSCKNCQTSFPNKDEFLHHAKNC